MKSFLRASSQFRPRRALAFALLGVGVATVTGLQMAQTANADGYILFNENQITQAVSGMSSTHKLKRGVISEIHINTYGANAPIEDSFKIHPAMHGAPGALFGMFDGHSGTAASHFCRDELLNYIEYYHQEKKTPQLLSKLPFLEADHHFLNMSLREDVSRGLSGACLAVAHVAGDVVKTAHAGDCRAIIVRKETSLFGGTVYRAIELTQDHQIDTNPAERQRLLSQHPDEKDVIHRNRVKGRLQPTRGMGDGMYKMIEFYNARKDAGKLRSQYKDWRPPYTTVEPDLASHQLSFSAKAKDVCLVMATDGLFQDLTSQQVADGVGRYLDSAELQAENKNNVSVYLTKQSLLAASEYAMGKRPSSTENLSWIVQLWPGNRRRVHDDTSIIVAFFDKDSSFASDGPAPSLAPVSPPPTYQKFQKTYAHPQAKL